MTTFAELGIPFPLFEGRTDTASEYVGISACALCGGRDQHSFRMFIGSDLVLPCPACGKEQCLDGHEREAGRCRSCGARVPFPDIPPNEEFHVCYGCLRAGRVAFSKSTELGVLDWEDARQGVIHDLWDDQPEGYERVPIEGEDDAYGIPSPKEDLLELLRTPTYISWQDESWLFCCQRPMIYVGEWADLMASPQAPEDPEAFFRSIIEQLEYASPDHLWHEVCHGLAGDMCVYVFRCQTCGRYRANWDRS